MINQYLKILYTAGLNFSYVSFLVLRIPAFISIIFYFKGLKYVEKLSFKRIS